MEPKLRAGELYKYQEGRKWWKMLEEPIREMLKAHIGITDEDLDRVGPGMQKLLTLAPEMPKWRIIAEVTDSEYCFAGCKVGDKLVFQGPNVSVEESTCPLCVGAIAPMWERMHIMWDRLIDGKDPNESWLRYSACTDAGLEPGGLGRVLFKVYAEKVEG